MRELVSIAEFVQSCVYILPALGTDLYSCALTLMGVQESPRVESNVSDTTFATTLAREYRGELISVRTVEHVLSALYAFGVDNALLEVDASEVPVMDGSAGPFVDELSRAGLREQAAPVEHLVIRREVRVSDGNKWAMVSPSSKFTIRYEVDFDHPLVSSKPVKLEMQPEQFANYCATARTFGFKRDVDAMRQRGLALGGRWRMRLSSMITRS